MSDPSERVGWLPVEARDLLEDERDRASAAEADKLLKLDPRARVLALMERAACRSAEDSTCPALRPADLARVLGSFTGVVPPDADHLARHFPQMVVERASDM